MPLRFSGKRSRMEENPLPASPRRPVHAWVGLCGGLLAGLAFVTPTTHVLDRTLTAWDLLSIDEELLGKLESQREALPGPLKDPPGLGKKLPGPFEKIEEKRAEVH